jgi:hypothetical protein
MSHLTQTSKLLHQRTIQNGNFAFAKNYARQRQYQFKASRAQLKKYRCFHPREKLD